MHTNTPVLFPFVLKLHDAIDEGKERIVAPHTNIEPRFKRRTTLPHQDMASAHLLAGKALHAEAFADTITAVGGAALAFFVCHAATPMRDPLASEGRARSVLVRGCSVRARARPVLRCKYR